MSNYKEASSNVTSTNQTISTSLSSIKNISFDGVWSGDAYNSLSKALQQSIESAENVQNDLEKFSEILSQLEQYKALKEEIDALTEEINSITIPSSPPEAAAAAMSKKNSLIAKRETLITQKNQLRQVIEASLAAFKSIEAKIEVIQYDPNQYKDYLDYLLDVDELLAIYMNGKKDNIPGDGLIISDDLAQMYDSYDENGNRIKGSGLKYIEEQILNIQKKYSGREAAVNSALLILQLAADKGIKIEYDAHGTSSREPYVKTETLLEGIDCNPFASWVIDKGTPGGFQWRPVPNFGSVGVELSDWTQAQPGDMFYYKEGNGTAWGHVGIIIENNPETKTFITAEAANTGEGIVLKTQTYDNLHRRSYHVHDMTNVYNGTQNTNRKEFEGIISQEGFDRGI